MLGRPERHHLGPAVPRNHRASITSAAAAEGGLAAAIEVDHFAVSVPDLDARVARMKAAGIKVLEDIHPWGNMRAAMVEGPDRVAIELVEVK